MTATEVDARDRLRSEHLVVVSSDAHVGPRLVEDLRPYCPTAYLEDFDAYIARDVEERKLVDELQPIFFNEDRMEQDHRLLRTAGHYDMDARRADMDADGVAAEVIFHSSLNFEPIPFQGSAILFDVPTASPRDLELMGVGYRIYNRWLADAVSTCPGRHIGLVHLPMWDIDAALDQLEWARAAGLRGVNFPAPRAGIPSYVDPRWEPFWERCAALEMPLATHAGGTNADKDLFTFEIAGWPARRAMYHLVFTGAFERHPALKLVLTEQPGEWWDAAMREMDSAQKFHKPLNTRSPKPASEYCATNVFIGASFMARYEAEAAVRDGYATNALWGSDYPHSEGTWEWTEPGEPNRTRLALQNTFGGLPAHDVGRMVGENAARVYGLDLDELRVVAARIQSPTPEDLARRPEHVPAQRFSLAFREFGPWA